MTDLWLFPLDEGDGLPLRLEPPGPLTIGRAPGHTLTLPDRSVSRLHATLVWSAAGDVAERAESADGVWRLSDAGSQSGTFVNGVRIEGDDTIPIRAGDHIGIGPYAFEVRDRARRSGPRTVVSLADANEGDAVEAVKPAGAAALTQQHLIEVLALSETIHQAKDEATIHEALVEGLSRITGFPNAAIVRLDPEGEDAELLASRGEVVDRFGRPSISRSLVRRAQHEPVIIRAAGGGQAAASATMNSLAIHRAVCMPLRHGTSNFGTLYLDDRNAHGDAVDLDALANVAHVLVRMAALSLQNLTRARTEQRLEHEQRLMFGGTMHALIAAIDAKDPYTRGHSDRVSAFAALLAEHAGLGARVVEQARLCGLVHDIGKIGVPESVLRKPGRLTDEEMALIAAHPQIGHEILRDIPQMSDVLPGVLEHHERWDGTGYPRRLEGEAISLLGRLVCIADSFDAMTSARTYRPARSVSEVLEEIRRCLGTHFDPTLGAAFVTIPLEQLEAHVAPPAQPAADEKLLPRASDRAAA